MIAIEDITGLIARRDAARPAMESANTALRDYKAAHGACRTLGIPEMQEYEALQGAAIAAEGEYYALDRAIGYAAHAHAHAAAADAYLALYERRKELADLPLWYKRTKARVQSIAPAISWVNPERGSVTVRAGVPGHMVTVDLYIGRAHDPETGAYTGDRYYIGPADWWSEPSPYRGPKTVGECVDLARGLRDAQTHVDGIMSAARGECRAIAAPYALVGEDIRY